MNFTNEPVVSKDIQISLFVYFFFFNDPAPPEISPLPLPAALPISLPPYPGQRERCWLDATAGTHGWDARNGGSDHPLLGSLVPLAHPRQESVWDNQLAEIGRASCRGRG